jgi:hypothetical protein
VVEGITNLLKERFEMSTVNYQLTLVSGNKKTGPMPVSMTSKNSCPDVCIYRNNGCYAEFGPINIHWGRLNKAGLSLDEFCDRVSKLWKNQAWRHNQAGDLPGEGNAIDRSALSAIVNANKKARAKGFTFTHKPVGNNSAEEISNTTAIREANLNDFTINLSGNNLEHADSLASMDCGPVVAIVGPDAPRHGKTPQGRHYSVCPAQEREDVNCANCRLCSLPNRKAIIAFRVHGVKKKRALQVLQGI